MSPLFAAVLPPFLTGLLRTLLVLVCLGVMLPCAGANPVPAVASPVLNQRVVDLVPLQKEGRLVIGRHLDVLEDPGGMLGIAEVSSPARAAAFKPVTSAHPNFSYSDSAFWLRLTIAPQTGPVAVLLELAQPNLDSADLYVARSARVFEHAYLGDLLPWPERQIRHRNQVFRLALNPGGETTVYLRIASTNVLAVPMTIWSEAAFAEHEESMLLLLGLFYGLVGALALYNLILYASLRDRVYLYYVGYITSFGLALFTIDGLAFQFLWPNQVWWANRAMATFLSFALVFGALFACTFLDTPAIAPRADRMARAVAWGCLALGIISAVGWPLGSSAIMRVLSVLASIGAVLILSVALGALGKGYRPARYFLLAWFALLIFILIGALKNFGLAPVSVLTTFGLHFGLALDVVLLSAALAARIRLMREEVIHAQTQLIEASRAYQSTLERRARELAAANQELESFSYTVAHDLRAPLRAMDGYARFLEADHGERLPADGRRDLRLISKNAVQMSALIDALLEYSRLGRAEQLRQVVDMPAMVAHLLAERSIAGKAQFEVGPLHSVMGDATMFRRLWTHLIGNAVKFSASVAAPRIRIGSTIEGAEVVYSVRDNGVGFDMAYADKLFGMFQRLHQEKEFTGTGVGLAMVRRIVERHGGRVWADATPGGGACFCFALPVGLVVAQGPT